ncbi:MAG TPA: aminotransferase class V-fold PLP-dependent enzyme [Burkholderiales bacterium]
MLRSHYQTFHEAIGDRLHVLAHSHHPWPDVTREAQLAYWNDSARLAERKWQKIYDGVIPVAQAHVARLLNIDAPARIAFAPNTHELVARLYSCLDWSRPLRVLTTDREFASFARQTQRLEETGRVQVTRVAVAPYESFVERFSAAVAERYDFVYLSHVFYDSAFVVDPLERIVAAAHPEALFCIDGYHAFNALPIDLSRIAERVYYLAGGYKYAQAGEGVCFMSLPRDCALRPVYTGWFADTATQSARVEYAPDAQRFAGATFDAGGLYRFNAVMHWQRDLGIGPADIHAHAVQLQADFLDGLAEMELQRLPLTALRPPLGQPRGNFLSFELNDAAAVEAQLRAHDILADRRGNRLRFGFGLYHDTTFMNRLLARLRIALH